MNISLDKFYLRQSSETFERIPVIEDAPLVETWYGRGWAGPPVLNSNFAGIQSVELFESYTVASTGPFGAGTRWVAASVQGTNYRAIVAEETCEDYSVGTGDFPLSGGEGWAGNATTGTNA